LQAFSDAGTGAGSGLALRGQQRQYRVGEGDQHPYAHERSAEHVQDVDPFREQT
jgi:hypothetical protein